ncbi:MAG: LemA family protein [Candidatus Gracilibacteria bacterium]|nr:LemA family protein [Candidatus Gracilibacteria bacterium]
MTNTGKIVWGVILGVVVLIFFIFFGKYNSIVTMEESVNTAWAQVENQYQRRFDLIPNIVNTVKGEANFEKSTLEAVVNARASATKTTINVNDAKELAQFQQEQQGITQALSRLLMVTENYPNLKANQGFADLRVSLEGTENRISTERMRYNETVQKFNTYVRLFPNNIVSSFLGFEKKNLFESDAGANVAPKVDFAN